MESSRRHRAGIPKGRTKASRALTRIALDTNVIVALLAGSSSLQELVRSRLTAAGDRNDTVHTPFTCLGETWRTLTEPRGYGFHPDNVQLLLRRTVQFLPPLMPGNRYVERWLALANELQPAGAEVFDVQIAALCLEHRCTEIWTFDTRFPRVAGLSVVDPTDD